MELNKAVLDCMKSLRRRLREELALDIRLSQADAVEAMVAASQRSDDPETRELGARLAELSDLHSATEQPAAHPHRQYRGHELPDQPGEPQQEEEAQRGHSVRMYRGQRVLT